MKTHNDFIKLTIEYAKNSVARGGYPFGALVVKNGEIVGDNNRPEPLYNPINHAETAALINAAENLQTDDLTGCVLYSSCQPCDMCLSAIKWSGITEIYYAMDKADAQQIGHRANIFYDEDKPLRATKVADKELLRFMKQWYGNKF